MQNQHNLVNNHHPIKNTFKKLMLNYVSDNSKLVIIEHNCLVDTETNVISQSNRTVDLSEIWGE